jgi:hypothetical protein
MRKAIGWLLCLTLLACHHAARPPAVSSARCYEGVAFGFVDSIAAPAAPRRPFRQWLVLHNGRTLPRDGGRAVFIAAFDSTTFVGTQPLVGVWGLSGDSIVVDAMTFPAARWTLAVTATGLQGRLHAESDVIHTDASGVVVPHRDDWPAVLQQVSCDSVPAAGRLTIAEADKAPLL